MGGITVTLPGVRPATVVNDLLAELTDKIAQTDAALAQALQAAESLDDVAQAVSDAQAAAQAAAAVAADAAALLAAAGVDPSLVGQDLPMALTLEGGTSGDVLTMAYADGTVVLAPGLIATPTADGGVRLHPGIATGGFNLGPAGEISLPSVQIAGVQLDAIDSLEGVTDMLVTSGGDIVSYRTTDGTLIDAESAPDDTPLVITSATIGGVAVSAVDEVPGAVATWEGANGDIFMFVASDLSIVGEFTATETEATGFTDADVAYYQALAEAYTRRVENTYVSASFKKQLLHFTSFGQSLSNGTEGWPALSILAAYASNLSVGTSVHSNVASSSWTPATDGNFHPLVATVHNNTTGFLTALQQAALSPGATNKGETYLEGAMKFLKRALSDQLQLEEATDRRFCATSCGIGGKTVEQLSKGSADGPWFDHMVQAATAAKAAARTAGYTAGTGALMLAQGERNYEAVYGTTDRVTYKNYWAQLVSDWRADVEVGIYSQAYSAPVFWYQTSGTSVRDDVNLSISQAQLEMCRENDGWFMASPSYPVTDKGVHLDPNGYRWLGHYFGKAMAHVFLKQSRFEPTAPIGAYVNGLEVLVPVHCHVAPLVFDRPYTGTDLATDLAAKGFSAYDDSGAISITGIELAAPQVVKITLGRSPTTGLRLRGGAQATGGYMCLRDSDATVAADNYEYNPGSGQYAAANIPALVGKPYPLPNWCALFDIPITEA